MFKVLILFGSPADEVTFDRYFEATHRPILRDLPNLQALEINRVAGAMNGGPAFYLVTELVFASEDALQDGLNSKAGQTMARDYANFASGGVTVLLCTSLRVTSDGSVA